MKRTSQHLQMRILRGIARDAFKTIGEQAFDEFITRDPHPLLDRDGKPSKITFELNAPVLVDFDTAACTYEEALTWYFTHKIPREITIERVPHRRKTRVHVRIYSD